MNETLLRFKEILPQIKDYLGEDVMIGLTDGREFVGFWEGEKMKAPIQIGDKLKQDDPMIDSFRTGKVIDETLPPHIHGFPFRSITAPIKDNTGKIVGTIGIGSSLELIYSVENIMNKMNEKLDNTLSQVIVFNDNSEKINEKSVNVLNVMNHISETSKEISETTKKISAIANKTQILAINTSIEAARAGSFGQGFSVVAKEMKKLATTSQEASQKIFDLITELSNQVEKNCEELKLLQDSIENQKSSAHQISDNINSSKGLSYSVLDTIHKK